MTLRPLFVAIAGGSASGKSTVVAQLTVRLGTSVATAIAHDRYYRDRSRELNGTAINFDHPHALETDRLMADLRRLAAGRFIDAPVYDFHSHARLPHTDRIDPTPVVMVEGLFVLAEPEIREMCALRVFVDVPENERFARRLQRDTSERGRTPVDVRRQFDDAVRPMHVAFVEPSRAYADVIVSGGGLNETAIDQLARTIARMIDGPR